ncbi:hypothetical protein MNV49_006271 [Pseudohyphozyma bogoriensis]|nr:hypothetical protein MNV49_006271 [Pseudohyphozyma bogoriensis]
MSGTGSSDRSRLLEHLIHAQFGPAVGEIAGLLLTRGSLPITHLLRLSSLPPPIVFSSLLVLSLHSMLYHSENEINGRLLELYEINPVGVENRRRGSLYYDLVEAMPDGLSEAVMALWKEGMLSGPQIVGEVGKKIWEEAQVKEALGGDGVKQNGKSKKGKEKEKITSLPQAEKAAQIMLRRAIRDGFISIVTPGSQLSPESLEIKWEEELKLRIKNIPTSKDLKEMKEALREKKAQWFEEEWERARGKLPGGDPIKRKKRMLEGEEDDESLIALQKGAFYRLNAERFHIRWRNELMLAYAKNIYNDAVAAVFEIILKMVENEVETLEDQQSRTFTWNEVVSRYTALPNPPPLTNCFVPTSSLDPTWNAPTRVADNIHEICRVLERDDNMQVEAGRRFLTSMGGNGGASTKWAVNYTELTRGMTRAAVEALIKAKIDPVSLRCWRILEDKGKLDEKHLARLAFLPVKEARECLGKLTAAALIEQQEVPRSADRAPTRTFFLWFVDYNKVVEALIDHQYKALANLQAQKSHQLGLRKALVEKRERSDVREDPKLLSKRDQEQIRELDDKLEALTVAEMRIDKDLFIMQTSL